MSASVTPLRVLHICQRDDPATGGAVRVAVEYVKRLSNYQVDAHCLFLYGNPGYFQSELGDRAHYLNIQDSKEAFKFWRFPDFLQSFQPQILHHHDGLLWSHLFTFFHPGLVKIAHAHLGTEIATFLSRDSLAAWLQRQSTNLLICITEHTRISQIQQGKYLPKQTCLLYNGVDLARFYPPSLTQKADARTKFGLLDHIHVIGFVGRLHCQMKGVDDFLKVIANLPDNFWGLIVGAGPDFNTLRELAKTLKITDRVIFTGIVERTIDAYHAMDVFCLTSHWEPFGLVVAEAMACQVPVIGFACPGGVGELLTSETGCIVLERDTDRMAQSIKQVIEYPDSWQERHKNARRQLQLNHNWETNTQNLVQIYQDILQLQC